MKRFKPQKYPFQDQFRSFSLLQFYVHEYRGKHDFGVFCLAKDLITIGLWPSRQHVLSRMQCKHPENLCVYMSLLKYIKQKTLQQKDKFLVINFSFCHNVSKVAAALVSLSDYVQAYIEIRFLDFMNANHDTRSHQFRQLDIVRL